MPFPALTFPEQLDQATRQELEQLVSLFFGWLSKQHKDDGSHATVTADKMTLGADPVDGTWTGNVGSSLVPTVDGCDLGAVILAGTGSFKDHPFRNLRLSGSLRFGPFADSNSGISLVSPIITRSGASLTWAFAGGGALTLSLVSGINTHTVTFGAGVTGLTSNRVITGSDLIASSGGVTERGRSVAMGEWTDVAYAAGNFTTNTAATWTVDSGDQLALRYTLIGKTMILDFQINTSSVSAATPSELRIAIPGGFTAAGRYSNAFRAYDNGTERLGEAIVLSSGTVVALYANPSSGAAWAASANNTGAFGQLAFEVQ